MSLFRDASARFWIETALAGLTGILFVVTVITREWIELLFRVDPDGGDGSLEWVIVVVLAVLTVTFTALARAERRRLTSALGAG
jgi:hypothetical protein